MNKDNLEETKNLNRKSAANKEASNIPSDHMDNITNNDAFKKIKKPVEQPDINEAISGISKAAISTMSSSTSDINSAKK